MVENGKFLKRLRNVHLEKSVATGICRVQRSPKTAKTPAKVHLRLRFQNLGKPRTAGLCGRAVGACDCGPLSCAKIERPSPLEKTSCKVRLFAQNRSRKYRQKVTATTLFQTASDRVFSFPHKRSMFAFAGESGYTLGFAQRIAHGGSHAETRGVSDGGAITTLGAFRTFTNIPGPGIRTAYFAAFGSWPGGALEERRKPSGQRCAYARRCSEGVAAPLGCVILVRMLIALLGGPVANFPALWYDKVNKLESVMH